MRETPFEAGRLMEDKGAAPQERRPTVEEDDCDACLFGVTGLPEPRPEGPGRARGRERF